MTGGAPGYEKLFQVGSRWVTAEELEALRKGLGSADDILERNRQVTALLKAQEHRDTLWRFARRVGVAFVTLMGAVLTLKALLPPGWWLW